MCGRFTNATSLEVWTSFFGVQATALELSPRYNIAPSTDVIACRMGEEVRELVQLHWGLIPHWAKDKTIGYHTINARAETVATKPAFRSAFRKHRCLIAADGFYEWKPAKPRKEPYYIHKTNNEPFAFAGLWEHWEGDDETIESCSIIVTDANDLLRPVHDRMPVIIDHEFFEPWLDPKMQDVKALQALLKPYPSKRLEAYAVSQKVNKPQNEGPELVGRAR